MFLQEVEATVMLVDVRDFSPLAAQLGPVELGLALSRFYEHVADLIERHHGRVVKFMGDSVLAVFIGGTPDHRTRALEALKDTLATRQAFLDENATLKLPVLDYTIGVASGHVLAGELGTAKLRSFDIIGQSVNQAFRLTSLSARRGVSNLVAAETYEQAKDHARRPSAVETDMVEIGAEKLRLFKLEG
jgi:adenylate cyclase